MQRYLVLEEHNIKKVFEVPERIRPFADTPEQENQGN